MERQIEKIGYQGVAGAYSYQACQDNFPGKTYIGYRTFEEAFDAIQCGDVDCGMIPVENSTAGPVVPVQKLLPEANLKTIGEYRLPVHHCLMVPDLPADDDEILTQIKEVHSHHQALAQCKDFVRETLPEARTVEVFDTAGAAAEITKRKDFFIAAIASKAAADIYNMRLVKENIEDQSDNTTRFLILTS